MMALRVFCLVDISQEKIKLLENHLQLEKLDKITLSVSNSTQAIVEVKASNAATRSLNKLVDPNGKFPNVRYGIKLCAQNIGFNGLFYTFPYFLTFLLKRFLHERDNE